MDDHGKLTDVIIEEDSYWTDPLTGLKTLYSVIIVWADKNKQDLISKIPGVVKCFEEDDVRYMIFPDPRYNREFLKEEIKAQILISE
jgi:hypothetical protein